MNFNDIWKGFYQSQVLFKIGHLFFNQLNGLDAAVKMNEVINVRFFHEVELPLLKKGNKHFQLLISLYCIYPHHLLTESLKVDISEHLYLLVEDTTINIFRVIEVLEILRYWRYYGTLQDLKWLFIGNSFLLAFEVLPVVLAKLPDVRSALDDESKDIAVFFSLPFFQVKHNRNDSWSMGYPFTRAFTENYLIYRKYLRVELTWSLLGLNGVSSYLRVILIELT